jgi:hypothetical protein
VCAAAAKPRSTPVSTGRSKPSPRLSSSAFSSTLLVGVSRCSGVLLSARSGASDPHLLLLRLAAIVADPIGRSDSMFYLGAFIKIAHPSTAAGATVSASTAAGGRAATAAIMIFGIAFCSSWNGLAWIIVCIISLVIAAHGCARLTVLSLYSARKSTHSGFGPLQPPTPPAASGSSSSSSHAARPPCRARLVTGCSSYSAPSRSARAFSPSSAFQVGHSISSVFRRCH